jgi:uncharacterized spore protein YtfJ
LKLDEFITTVRDVITVRRVFGDPVIQDGTTVIPAASVWGGGGGGGGHDQQGQQGEGGGFGLHARPAGGYVIKDGVVRWIPAVDINRVLTLVGAVLITCGFSWARVAKLRAKAASTPE